MTESFCYIPETSTTLRINYTSIFKKWLEKKKKEMSLKTVISDGLCKDESCKNAKKSKTILKGR